MKKFACLFALMAVLSTSAASHAVSYARGSTQPSFYSNAKIRQLGDDSKVKEAPYYLSEATKCKRVRDWPGMADNLLKAIDMAPDAAQVQSKAWSEVSWLCNELGEYDNAMKAAALAIGSDEKAGDAWRELGYALLKKREYAKSLEALKTAKEKDDTPLVRRYIFEAEMGLADSAGNFRPDVQNPVPPAKKLPFPKQ